MVLAASFWERGLSNPSATSAMRTMVEMRRSVTADWVTVLKEECVLVRVLRSRGILGGGALTDKEPLEPRRAVDFAVLSIKVCLQAFQP